MNTNPIPTSSSVSEMIATNARISRARSELPGRSASIQLPEVGRSAVTAGSLVVGCSSQAGAPDPSEAPGVPGASGGTGRGLDSGLGLVTATVGPRGKLIGGYELVADAPDGLDAGLAG